MHGILSSSLGNSNDLKVLTEKDSTGKKPGRRKKRNRTTDKPPWRSKRLKENDEKLAASNFYCKECKKSFRTEDIFTAHMLDHENIDDVVSRINDTSGTRDGLSEDLFEISVVDKRREFKCRLCAHLFLDKRNAKSHQRIHDGTNPWYCALCDKHFVHKGHYVRHKETHNRGTNCYQCGVCRKSFSGFDALAKHRLTCCAPPVTTGAQLSCHLCQQLFHDKTSLDAHLAIHKVNSTLHCEQCDQDFSTRPAYDAHMKKHDSSASPENCLICGKQFLTKCEYELHAKSHEYEIYRCHACDETYNLLEDLEMHYQMSETCLDIVCAECTVQFDNVEELRAHLQVCKVISSPSAAVTNEPNEKIFVCRFCQRGYHLQTSFTEHMKIHYNAEKPIKCSGCEHVFDSEEKLTIHRKLVHENETKMSCVECGFLFPDETQLKRHVKAVHLQEKIFRCLPCVRTFYLRADLNKHLLSKQHLKKSIEAGFLTDKSVEKIGKQLPCAICEKCFPTSRELKRHEYLHQRIQSKPQPEKLTALAELGQQGEGVALPVYFNEAVYNFVDGEQVVLTTEEQASAFINTRIKIDESGNLGIVYVDKNGTEKGLQQTSSSDLEKLLGNIADTPKPSLVPQDMEKQVSSVSVQCDVPTEVESELPADVTIEECSEETFLALSEMVKQGKLDISSLGMIDSNHANV